MTLRWTLALVMVAACWRGAGITTISNVAPPSASALQPCNSLRRYLAMIPQDRPNACDPFDPNGEYWWCRWFATNDTLSAWKWWAWAATNDLEACAGGGR
jgi:hypothetical protein